MKIVLHVNHAEHQKQHAGWMAEGLGRHGVETAFAAFDCPAPCDAAVVWGARQHKVLASGVPVLVMERGHLQPRMEWTSCGWGGLGNRAVYAAPPAADPGARWETWFSHHLKPWRPSIRSSGSTQDERVFYGTHVVVFGQVEGDASLYGLREGFKSWATRTAARAAEAYRLPVIYRPHPLTVRQFDNWHPEGTELSTGDLGADLDRAAVAITYNSTAGVECVLAGVPTVVMDIGGMAWPVAGHAIGGPPPDVLCVDRTAWAHRLAWTQFTEDEIRGGLAWEHLGPVMPSATAPASLDTSAARRATAYSG